MIDAIKQEYDDLKKSFVTLLPKLRELRAGKLSELKEIDDLIADIEQKAGSLAEKRPRQSKRNSEKSKPISKPCSTVSEISGIITDYFEETPVSSLDALRGHVMEKLNARDRSLSIAEKLFRDCLKSNLLTEVAPGRFSLTT